MTRKIENLRTERKSPLLTHRSFSDGDYVVLLVSFQKFRVMFARGNSHVILLWFFFFFNDVKNAADTSRFYMFTFERKFDENTMMV